MNLIIDGLCVQVFFIYKFGDIIPAELLPPLCDIQHQADLVPGETIVIP